MKLSALLGEYPITRALKSGEIGVPGVDLEFLPGRPVTHFKRLVSALDIAIAEVPIMTFLMGAERGLPLVLLPAVVLGGYQHGFLYRHAERTDVTPSSLAGKRIGIRSYSVTTVTWLRDILERDHGVDPNSVNWVAFEEPHFADFQSPPNVARAPAGLSAEAMLEAGEIDAAVLRAVPDGAPFVELIQDANRAGESWIARAGGTQINHMVAVQADLAANAPQAVAAFLDALGESAALVPQEFRAPTPLGREAVLPSLELAIECALRQGIISNALRAHDLLSKDFTS